MKDLKLCESDYRFMLVVWENEPVASGRLVTLCADKLGWKKSTTYTVLRKLSERGFVRNKDAVVTSLIPKDRVQARQSDRFVEHAFGGSLPMFLASFLGGRKLSEKEAAELQRLIDAHKEE